MRLSHNRWVLRSAGVAALVATAMLLTNWSVVSLHEAQQQPQQRNSPDARQLFVSNLFNGALSRVFRFFKDLHYRWKVPELFRDVPIPPAHSTAIVIGSGFGGAISALRLAQAGIQTTVLERGQDWPISNRRLIHATESIRDGRGVWHKSWLRAPLVSAFAPKIPVDVFGGVLDVTEYENIEVWRGACVGGGSKVYTGVMIQPREEYFNAIFEETLSFAEMDQIYYPRVREMLKLSPIPDDIYDSPFFAGRRVWDEQASSAGYSLKRPDSVFNWDVVRDEMNGRSSPSAIMGESNMGNSNGAKFDLTQNYLKEAIESGFAKVYSNQQVMEISKTGGVYSVVIEKLNPYGRIVDQYTVTSDYLFLAAGSIGTSELLVKAKATGTVANLNESIGKEWGTNGDSILVKRLQSTLRGINQASPCSAEIHDIDGELPVTLEAWFIPGVPVDIGLQGSLGMAVDLENRGHFEYVNGKVELSWPKEGNKKAEEAARQVHSKIAETGSPRSSVGFMPLAPDVFSGFTAHPLGGAVLGKATDNYGRVQGVDRLYVMDGAAIPGSTGAVNPSLTISALAERNIEQIIAQDF